MAYDKTIDISYSFDAVDCNAGDTLKCTPPAGKTRGVIRTIIITGQTQVTGAGAVYAVGNETTVNRYLVNTSLTGLQAPDQLVMTEAQGAGVTVVDLENDEAAPVAGVEVDVNAAGTGGTADFLVVIGWF